MKTYRVWWEFREWEVICLVIPWIGPYHLLLTRQGKKEFVSWIFLQKAYSILGQLSRGLREAGSSLISRLATAHSQSLSNSLPFLTPFHSLFQSVMPLSTLSILQTHLLYHHHHAAFPDFLRKLLPLLPLGFPDSWVGSNCLCHSWLLSMTLEQIALSYKCTTINFLRAEMKSHAQISSTGPQTWGNSINIW